MKKISINSGVVVPLLKTGIRARGASWGADDEIVSTFSSPGLVRISADGGTPDVLISSDASEPGSDPSWPEILPSGQVVLFDSAGAVMAQRLDTG